MENKNKSLKISARISGTLNAVILLILYLMLFQFSEYFPQTFLNKVVNNLEVILYLAYALLLISIISALLVKQRPKQEKYNIFFVYLALSSINLLVIMYHIALNGMFNTAIFG